MLLSSSSMEHTSETPLTTVQQCVADALAAGCTLSDAAEANHVNRVTVYRWMKTLPQFTAALRKGRADFAITRRDDLHYLSNRAIQTLVAILDNPRSSPAVLLRASMFILQRPQLPKTGWTMPEPAPNPDGEVLLDSAIIEKDYANLPGVYGIEREEDTEPQAAPEETPEPAAAETPCNEMQHETPVSDVASAPPIEPQTRLRSCRAEDEVAPARDVMAEVMEELAQIEAEGEMLMAEYRQGREAARETAGKRDPKIPRVG